MPDLIKKTDAELLSELEASVKSGKPDEYQGKTYSTLEEVLELRIKAGQVVEYKGRTAASVDELRTIKGYADGSYNAVLMNYAHDVEAASVPPVSLIDEAGQKSKPFTPEYVAETRADANKPGATTVTANDSANAPASENPDETATQSGLPQTESDALSGPAIVAPGARGVRR